MSRVIDTSDLDALTEDDILYLQDRGLLPEGVKPVAVEAEQGEAVDLSGEDEVIEEEAEEEVWDYEAMKVRELQDRLRQRDVKYSRRAKKPELIELLEADDQKGGE